MPVIGEENNQFHYDEDGLLHREDGPAIEWADGTKWWYWNGKRLDVDSQEEFERLVRLKAFW